MNLLPFFRHSGTDTGLSCSACTPGCAPAIDSSAPLDARQEMTHFPVPVPVPAPVPAPPLSSNESGYYYSSCPSVIPALAAAARRTRTEEEESARVWQTRRANGASEWVARLARNRIHSWEQGPDRCLSDLAPPCVRGARRCAAARGGGAAGGYNSGPQVWRRYLDLCVRREPKHQDFIH